jgi:hypothetical protein
MRHTASADLGVPGVRPRPFVLLSARLRPSVFAVAVLIVLLVGCGGGTDCDKPIVGSDLVCECGHLPLGTRQTLSCAERDDFCRGFCRDRRPWPD